MKVEKTGSDARVTLFAVSTFVIRVRGGKTRADRPNRCRSCQGYLDEVWLAWRVRVGQVKSVVLVFWPFSTFPGIVPSLPCPSSLATTVATNARNHDLAQGLRQATRPSRIWNNFVTLKTRYVAKSQNLERRRKRNGKCEMGLYVKHTAAPCLRPAVVLIGARAPALALESSAAKATTDRARARPSSLSPSVRLAIEGSGGGGAFCGRQRSRLWLDCF